MERVPRVHRPVVRPVDMGRTIGRGGLGSKGAQTSGQIIGRAVDRGQAIERGGLGSKGAQTSGQSCRQGSGHRQRWIGFQGCTDQWSGHRQGWRVGYWRDISNCFL